VPDPQAALFDDDDGVCLERHGSLGEADGKPLLNPRCATPCSRKITTPVVDPPPKAMISPKSRSKVRNAAFLHGKREDIRVGQLLQATIEEMNSVMTVGAQPHNDAS
jgi:hypothetical protein